MKNLKEFASKKTKFRRTLFEKRDNIFTVCIASTDNPMGVQFSEEENRKRRENLEKDLNTYKLKYYRVKGKYGNDENSYIIANINLTLCYYLFGPKKYNQESFIFGEVQEYGSIIFSYFQQEGKGDFKRLDVSKEIKGQSDADDLFTSYLGYKFQIPFSIFAKSIDNISESLERDYGWDLGYKLTLEKLALKENPTLVSLYRSANANLLTEEQERRRLLNLKELLKK